MTRFLTGLLTVVLLIVVVALAAGSGATAGACTIAAGSPNAAPARGGASASDGVHLDSEQARNASTIVSVVKGRGLPERAAAIALMTAMTESTLHNDAGGDLDSAGLFQQRPSMGWGTRSQILDPVYATNKFLDALTRIPDWQSEPMWAAAQAVQRSGIPTAYQAWQNFGTQLATKLWGATAALTCPDTGLPATGLGARIVAAAKRYLGWPYVWGGGTPNGPSGIDNIDGLGPGFDCSGLTLYAVAQATDQKVILIHYVPSQYSDPHVHHIGYNQLTPGDLVFMENFGHVGIYIGNHEIIHAPTDQPPEPVKISPLVPGTWFYANYVAAGRIVP